MKIRIATPEFHGSFQIISMITVEQIKAARALLDWNQDDLAAHTGISKPALANIERRLSSPRQETISAIQAALEEAGIEFIDSSGVRLNSSQLKVQVFKGRESIVHLWNDIFETLKNGEERLITGVEEKKFLKLGTKFQKMIHQFHKKGIKGRILCLEGEKNFPDITSEYRCVPKKQFMDTPYYVYGNKYAILILEPEMNVVIIENKVIADTYRKQFERHWQRAKKIT